MNSWSGYTINADPYNPGCLWTNSDSGEIVPFTSEGDIGCSRGQSGSLTFQLPDTGCSRNVTSWKFLNVTNPLGWMEANVTVRDESGTIVLRRFNLTEGNSMNLQSLNLGQAMTVKVEFPSSFVCPGDCILSGSVIYDVSEQVCCSL